LLLPLWAVSSWYQFWYHDEAVHLMWQLCTMLWNGITIISSITPYTKEIYKTGKLGKRNGPDFVQACQPHLAPMYHILFYGILVKLQLIIVIPFHMVHSCHMRWTASSWYQNWYQDETAHKGNNKITERWLILSVCWLMSFAFPLGRLLGVR
jgi:hypothetical protein